MERLVAELKPDAPLRSVSFAGNEPAAVNSYNTLLAGTFKLDAPLPDTIGVINTTSCDEIYEYFLAQARKNLATPTSSSRRCWWTPTRTSSR